MSEEDAPLSGIPPQNNAILTWSIPIQAGFLVQKAWHAHCLDQINQTFVWLPNIFSELSVRYLNPRYG